MKTPQGTDRPGDDILKPQEAILRWSVRGLHWSINPMLTHMLGALCGFVGVCIFLLGLELGSPGLGLFLAASILSAGLWWLWSYLPRRLDKRQRDDTLKALGEKLTAVRFKDGSISDFSPTGGFLLSNGSAIAFDTIRLLGRNIHRPGTIRTDIDWIWGLDDFGRFEVRDVPIKGWRERVRQSLGGKPRRRIAFSAFARKDGTTVDWTIAPGYAAKARQLVVTLNRKLADRDLGAET